jgi:repressor LexA
MTRRQLTPKQTAFFRYVQTFVDRNGGAWPTYRELVDYFGYRSPNSVTQNLQALVRKGVLERDGEGYRIPGQAQPSSPPGACRRPSRPTWAPSRWRRSSPT